jgi:hypothetical protein
MAAKVKDETVTFGSGSGSKYDWDQWFDGGTWILVRKEDFQTEVDTFQTTVLIRARKRGVKVLTKKVGADRLAIRQVGPRA